MTPLVSAPPAIDLGWVSLVGAIVSEFLFGLGLGLTTRLVLCALQAGGGLIDNDLALSAAQQLSPTAGISGGVMNRVLMLIGLAFFWMSDYLSALIVGIQQSFRVLPIGSAVVTQASIEVFARLAGEIFAAGLIIAAPIAILCFIVTMGLGFLSRSVHQLNVFNESFTLRVAIGGSGVVLFLPLLLDLSRFGLERMLPAAADYFRAMS
jgi:flagellar biosynthesis protein FliR